MSGLLCCKCTASRQPPGPVVAAGRPPRQTPRCARCGRYAPAGRALPVSHAAGRPHVVGAPHAPAGKRAGRQAGVTRNLCLANTALSASRGCGQCWHAVATLAGLSLPRLAGTSPPHPVACACVRPCRWRAWAWTSPAPLTPPLRDWTWRQAPSSLPKQWPARPCLHACSVALHAPIHAPGPALIRCRVWRPYARLPAPHACPFAAAGPHACHGPAGPLCQHPALRRPGRACAF